ncbi:MAG: hypothetical protein Q7S79_02435, partial [bacterium]|nr:hypothetical protein [bacterium]
MVHERLSNSGNPQQGSDRQRALYQLGKDIDPFQDGLQGERIRAIGLKNLYLQMVDPSVEYIEGVIKGLMAVPFPNLPLLGSITSNAAQNPRSYFRGYGVELGDPEKMLVGVGNTSQLIDTLLGGYDSETGMLNYGYDINPKVFAEGAYRRVQQNKAERRIVMAAK